MQLHRRRAANCAAKRQPEFQVLVVHLSVAKILVELGFAWWQHIIGEPHRIAPRAVQARQLEADLVAIQIVTIRDRETRAQVGRIGAIDHQHEGLVGR